MKQVIQLKDEKLDLNGSKSHDQVDLIKLQKEQSRSEAKDIR